MCRRLGLGLVGNVTAPGGVGAAEDVLCTRARAFAHGSVSTKMSREPRRIFARPRVRTLAQASAFARALARTTCSISLRCLYCESWSDENCARASWP